MSPGTHKLLVATDSGSRDAICYVPTTPFARNVLLAFHGAGTCAEAMVEFSGLNEVADGEGWVLVYPNGSGRTPDARTWNARSDCGYAGRKNINDVGFVDLLLNELTDRLPAPRFFATGMSNGGMMCYRLANELPHRVFGIAPVAGVMPVAPNPTGPAVSVLHLHGTLDEFVPFDGGRGSQNRLRDPMLSAPESVAAWASRNGCERAVPNRRRLTPVASDSTSVEFWDFGVGRRESRVQLYKIEGGGHTWPGRTSDMKFLGTTTQNLRANSVIADFFRTLSNQ